MVQMDGGRVQIEGGRVKRREEGYSVVGGLN